jgi:hypothetical protein
MGSVSGGQWHRPLLKSLAFVGLWRNPAAHGGPGTHYCSLLHAAAPGNARRSIMSERESSRHSPAPRSQLPCRSVSDLHKECPNRTNTRQINTFSPCRRVVILPM